jgi:hypothetical protein
MSLVVLIAALLGCREAYAYPWMARHEYFGCATCHSDPSGGGLLTRYGRAQDELLLTMRYSGSGEEGSQAEGSPYTRSLPMLG